MNNLYIRQNVTKNTKKAQNVTNNDRFRNQRSVTIIGS